MKNFRLYKDDNGESLPVVDAPDWIDYRVLAAGVAESHTVPTGAKVCVIFANTDCYLKASAAAVPAGDITDGSGPLYIPAGAARVFPCLAGSRYVSAGAFSVISANAGVIGLEFYE